MIRRRRPRFYPGECKDILRSVLRGDVASGEYVGLFERRFASFTGRKHAVATSSGRNGMELLLDALGVGSGDEVIMPAYTLKDLIELIERKGVKPVLVDVDADTFNIDPSCIEEKITERTKVIVATHMFGVPCEVDRVIEIARKHGIKVIEDCAHAHGALYKGEKTGSFGDAAFFSLEMTKLVNTFGGGIVVTDDAAVAEKVKEAVQGYASAVSIPLKKIAFMTFENMVIMSPFFPLLIWMFNTMRSFVRLYWAVHKKTRVEYSRYSNLQALIGLRQMDRLEKNNARRASAARKLISMLPAEAAAQKVPEGADRVYYFLVVKLSISGPLEEARRDMLRHGVDSGIGEEITDNCALLTGAEGDYPVAGELYGHNLQIPLYDALDERAINRIAWAVNKVCRQQQETLG